MENLSESLEKQQQLQLENEGLKKKLAAIFTEMDEVADELMKGEANLVKEKEITRRQKQILNLLQSFYKEMLSIQEQDETYDLFIKFITEKIGYQRSVIFKKGAGGYRVFKFHGYNSAKIDGSPLPPSLAETLLLNRHLLVNSKTKPLQGNSLGPSLAEFCAEFEIEFFLLYQWKINASDDYVIMIGNVSEKTLRQPPLSEFDLEILGMLAGQVAATVENEIKSRELRSAKLTLLENQKEMELATRIQTALIPNDVAIDNYDLTMALITATEVGGDLIDYSPRPDGHFWLAVGDVTGHGLTPGLVMMMAQSMFACLISEKPGAAPSELLIHINHALYHNVQERMHDDDYMTLQLIRHEGDGNFVVAGMHCDIFIFRAAAGSVECIEVPGFWTGLIPDIQDLTVDCRFKLEADDVLLLYTDGLIEAKNSEHEQYDIDRLQRALANYARLSVEEIKANILAEVRAWMSEQLDDISIIVLKRHPVA